MSDFIVKKNETGAWEISDIVNGYLLSKVYYFYTKKDAVRLFKEHKKEFIASMI